MANCRDDQQQLIMFLLTAGSQSPSYSDNGHATDKDNLGVTDLYKRPTLQPSKIVCHKVAHNKEGNSDAQVDIRSDSDSLEAQLLL